MKFFSDSFVGRLWLFTCFSVASTLGFAAPADDVKALLERGKNQAAYEAGKARPDELGTPLFDFYFGIAALNAGVPGEGVLALERYLLAFPDNSSARFHLARGYFMLGDDWRASQEFARLVPLARGAELESIQQFLDAIRVRESRYKPASSGFIELGAAYDNNINAGVASGQVAGLPAGFVVEPGQSSQRQADFQATVAAGWQGVYPFAVGWALYGGTNFSGRFNAARDNQMFNQSVWGLQGGVSHLRGRHLYRFGVDLSQLTVANQAYLNLATLVGEWQYQRDPFNRYGVSLQWSDLAYKNIDTYLDRAKTLQISSGADVRDSRLTNLSTSWTHTLTHPWNPVLTANLSIGKENNRKDRPDLSRDLWGTQFAVAFEPASRLTLGAGLAYQNSRYRQDFAPGIVARRDIYHALNLNARYALDRYWSLGAQYQKVDQQANIGFFRYTRDAVLVKLRYDFK